MATRKSNGVTVVNVITGKKKKFTSEAEAEHYYEMVSAFGEGATVVDVFTGKTFKL